MQNHRIAVRMFGWAILLLSITTITCLQAGAAPQDEHPATKSGGGASTNAPNGKLLFASRGCASCHGVNAQGGLGPRIAPPPVDFPGFIKQVRQPEGEMPAFASDKISDSDLADVYAFLKASPSSQPAQPVAASSNGNSDNGKKLFMNDGCYECHGMVGQGSTQTGGARIGPPAISLEAMIQYVHHPSGQMPPYTNKVISDQELTDIYAYLKAQPKPPAAKDIPLLNQ